MTEAFHLIPHNGNRGLFIFGDHASRHIPQSYDNLGLSGDDLTRHIAWDIGTETIVRRLCEHFKCAGQLAAVSRLVIDLNRDPDAPGLIPVTSDGTTIPGNENLNKGDRQDRVSRFYAPYHQQINDCLEALGRPFVISVHSFTPKPLTGELRETDIGLLVRHDQASAETFRDSLISAQSQERIFNVGMNLPYSAYDLNYTVDAHIAPRGLPHLAIEIRQDHIFTDTDAIKMADRLVDHLTVVMRNGRE